MSSKDIEIDESPSDETVQAVADLVATHGLPGKCVGGTVVVEKPGSTYNWRRASLGSVQVTRWGGKPYGVIFDRHQIPVTNKQGRKRLARMIRYLTAVLEDAEKEA